MQLNTAIYLYRALLRECRHQLHRYGLDAISLRAPINSMAGSFNALATSGTAYQLETLQILVPGLAVLPQVQQLPLTLSSMRQLIRDNFRANAAAQPRQDAAFGGNSTSNNHELSALDQGFAALRALPQQAYLEACSSRAETDGVVIEATSCFSPEDTFPTQTADGSKHWFKYRICITNTRQHPVKILGRGWVINNHEGELENYVMLTPDNAIVGQKPTIPPGCCFEYVSCTPLKNAQGPGQMQGQLMVDLLGPANGNEESQAGVAGDLTELARVRMPVAPFRLQTMHLAAQAVAAARSRQQCRYTSHSMVTSSADTAAGGPSSKTDEDTTMS